MNGFERFEHYLKLVDELLDKSATDQNPGWWLFTNGLRTPMFMLEALSKLYSKLHDKSLFNKLQEKFKQLEDVLGDIDYYNAYGEEYKNKPDVQPEALQHFEDKKQEHLQLLNKVLRDERWIGNDKPRIASIRKKLSEASWLSEKDEIKLIRKFYLKSIVAIKEFHHSAGGNFTDMESQVHEIRRKIRWLSIYPQALRGSIQLSEQHMPEPYLAKYFTPEIVNSPFNKLPEPTGSRHNLYLDKNHFLAMSWLIAELGKLKDAGLGIIALEHASTPNRENSSSQQAEAEARIQEHLRRASEITQTFLDEGNLDKLVVK